MKKTSRLVFRKVRRLSQDSADPRRASYSCSHAEPQTLLFSLAVFSPAQKDIVVMMMEHARINNANHSIQVTFAEARGMSLSMKPIVMLNEAPEMEMMDLSSSAA